MGAAFAFAASAIAVVPEAAIAQPQPRGFWCPGSVGVVGDGDGDGQNDDQWLLRLTWNNVFQDLWCIDQNGFFYFAWLVAPHNNGVGTGVAYFVGKCPFNGGQNFRGSAPLRTDVRALDWTYWQSRDPVTGNYWEYVYGVATNLVRVTQFDRTGAVVTPAQTFNAPQFPYTFGSLPGAPTVANANACGLSGLGRVVAADCPYAVPLTVRDVVGVIVFGTPGGETPYVGGCSWDTDSSPCSDWCVEDGETVEVSIVDDSGEPVPGLLCTDGPDADGILCEAGEISVAFCGTSPPVTVSGTDSSYAVFLLLPPSGVPDCPGVATTGNVFIAVD